MMAFISTIQYTPPRMVSSLSPWTKQSTHMNPTGVTLATSPVAQTYFIPVFVPTKTPVIRYWYANGTTVSGGATIQVGIYTDAYGIPDRRLSFESGTQNASLSLQVQFYTLATPITLVPGLYWIAIASSSATNTNLCGINYQVHARTFQLNQASTTLPTPTATPVRATGGQFYPVFGFATSATP